MQGEERICCSKLLLGYRRPHGASFGLIWLSLLHKDVTRNLQHSFVSGLITSLLPVLNTRLLLSSLSFSLNLITKIRISPPFSPFFSHFPGSKRSRSGSGGLAWHAGLPRPAAGRGEPGAPGRRRGAAPAAAPRGGGRGEGGAAALAGGGGAADVDLGAATQ